MIHTCFVSGAQVNISWNLKARFPDTKGLEQVLPAERLLLTKLLVTNIGLHGWQVCGHIVNQLVRPHSLYSCSGIEPLLWRELGG